MLCTRVYIQTKSNEKEEVCIPKKELQNKFMKMEFLSFINKKVKKDGWDQLVLCFKIEKLYL